MNFKMMLLADCVTLFSQESGSDADLSDISSRRALMDYVKSIGEVCEVRAVAYHDINRLEARKKSKEESKGP